MLFEHEQQHRASAEGPRAFNPIAAAAAISPLNVDRYLRRGRRLQAEAIARFATGAGRGAAALTRRLIGASQHWREVRHTEQVLRSLSPQTLRDIGIEGHQIPAIARGIGADPRNESRGTTHVQSLRGKSAAPRADCCLDKAA